MSKLSQFFGGGGGGVTGEIKGFAGVKQDGEWLRADGSAYLKEDYPELFAFLGPRLNLVMASFYTEVLETTDGQVVKIEVNKDGTLLLVLKVTAPYFDLYRISGSSINLISNANVVAPNPPAVAKAKSSYDAYSLLFNNLTGAIHVGNRVYILNDEGELEDAQSGWYTKSDLHGQSPSGEYMFGVNSMFKIKANGDLDTEYSNTNIHFPCVTNDGRAYGLGEKAATTPYKARNKYESYGENLVLMDTNVGDSVKVIYEGFLMPNYATSDHSSDSTYTVYYQSSLVSKLSPQGDILVVAPSDGARRSGPGIVSSWGFVPRLILPEFYFLRGEGGKAYKITIPTPVGLDSGHGSSVEFSEDGNYVFIGFGVRHAPAESPASIASYPFLVYEVVRDTQGDFLPVFKLIDTESLRPTLEGKGSVNIGLHGGSLYLSTEKNNDVLRVGLDMSQDEFRVPYMLSDPFNIKHIKT